MSVNRPFFETVRDPAFWETVRTSPSYAPLREYLLEKWKTYGDCVIPALKFSDYRTFFDSGERDTYENSYYLRRRTLIVASLLAVIYPDVPEYLTRLEDAIFAVACEYSWCLPAHVGNCTTDDPVALDLFACETGSAFGEISVLLGGRLSPLIRSLMKRETERRIINPYLSGKKYWWLSARHNWSSVCISAIATAVYCFRPEIFLQTLPRFRYSMDCFLSGYGDDGFCLEGIDYWWYGFGYFLCYAEMERYATEGKYDYFKDPKVRKIAAYQQKVIINEGKVTVSFSDGSRTAEVFPGLMHFLRNEYGEEIELLPSSTPGIAEGCARYSLATREIAWFDPALGVDPVRANTVYRAEDAGWWIVKNPAYGFAAKAGNNDEPHNHNDVGSFIVAKDGKQIFGDVGAGLYTRQYFRNETRYGIINCSSLGHSVPYFGDAVQKYGKQYCAENVKYGEKTFSFDLASAYGDERLASFSRCFAVSPDSVTVSDRFDWRGEAPAVERFMLFEEPTLIDGGFTVGGLTCRLEGKIERTSVVPFAYELHHAGGKTRGAWFFDAELQKGADGCTLTIEF